MQQRQGQVVDIGDMTGPQRTGTPGIQDPSAQIEGMAPNFGQFVAPHIYSFQGLFANVSNVYRASDEALRASYENSRCMTNDPTIWECIEQRMRATCLLDWHLEVDDPKNSEQREFAEEMTRLVKMTPRFMQYRESLMKAIWFGRSANTHRWRWKTLYGKPRLILDRWLPVHGDKLVFRYDKGNGEYNPDQVGIRVGGGIRLGDQIANRWKVESVTEKIRPADYGLAYFLEEFERPLIAIHRHMIEDGEYESPEYAGRVHGVGIRSRIYWTWYQKQEALAFLMEFLERSAFGIEMWYYPAGNAQAKEQAKKAATERIGDGRNVILVPRPVGENSHEFGVERIEPGMAGAQVLKEILIEYFGHTIKRYILGQTLTSEASATGLGSNVASIHLDTFLQIVRYDAINLEETLTTDFLEPLRNYNFPKFRDIPIRFKIDTEGEDTDKKLANYKTAFDMGLAIKAEEVAGLIGAMMPTEGDAVLRSAITQQSEQTTDDANATATSVGMPNTDLDKQLFDQMKRAIVGDSESVESYANQRSPSDRLKGGRADGLTEKDFDTTELHRGAKHEMEHTNDWRLAKEIAMDHLAEDPDYYRKLNRRMRDNPGKPVRYSANATADIDGEPLKIAREIIGDSITLTPDHVEKFSASWQWNVTGDDPLQAIVSDNIANADDAKLQSTLIGLKYSIPYHNSDGRWSEMLNLGIARLQLELDARSATEPELEPAA